MNCAGVTKQMDHRRIIPRNASPVRPRVNAGSACGDAVFESVVQRAQACLPATGQGPCAPGQLAAYVGQTTPATPVVQATGSATYLLVPQNPMLGSRLIIQAAAADSLILYLTSAKIGIDEHVIGGAVGISDFLPTTLNGGSFPWRKAATPAQGYTVVLLNTSNGNTASAVGVSISGISV